ncbi:CdaR family protein [Paenibacillus nasutitermitis]|uniref:YbbR domain-containing protein n=1 Tax=Paenibacillus nasutitermitis TaxID=1652958 RepID=A0A916ZKD2_9BACL|nr:CdaR family protein [Paenibacillus nasutitermitis]GGE02228.1 hypothetical protein GCM10010911_71600 [Paenibacillus nasutitermitis]
MDKWLSHPTALKIISLAIGILLWAVVHFDSERSPNSVASLTEVKEYEAVQVNAVGLDENNYALRLVEPSAVKLAVRATKSTLLQTAPDDFQVTVDVSQAKEGSQVLPITISKPNGVEVVSKQPSTVTVVLERMITKEFEIQVKTEGEPKNGYKPGTPIVKPNKRVHVTLPEDVMNDVGFVGATVSVDGEEATINQKKVKVIVLDKNGKEMTEAIATPSVVEVEIPITMPVKKIPLQIGLTGNLPDGNAMDSFTASVEQISIYGPQNVLDKVDFYDGLKVDLSKLSQSGTIELDIPPPEGVVSVEPSKVTVKYTLVPVSVKTLTQLKVTFISLSDGLTAKITAPEKGMVDVPVRGSTSVLAGVTAKDVQIIADLNGLGPGSHIVPLEVHLPSFVELTSTIPMNITVEIAENPLATAPPGSGNDPPAGEGPTGTKDNDTGNGGTGSSDNPGDVNAGTNEGTDGSSGAGTGNHTANNAGGGDAGSAGPSDPGSADGQGNPPDSETNSNPDTGTEPDLHNESGTNNSQPGSG